MTLCKAISCYQERLPTLPKPDLFTSIMTFGIANIMSQERLWCSYHAKCLNKMSEGIELIGNLNGIFEICEMETFETWFNVIYEPKRGEKSETIGTIKYSTHYGSLGGAIDKAKELKRKLQDEASGSDPSNWDKHVRPLDIVKVEKSYLSTEFEHVGVYLGDNKVCHIYDYWNNSAMKARVDDVSVFLGNTSSTTRIGRYDLANRNCEHFANMCVYGINFSEQYSINNGKSTLKLTNEINETNGKLGYSRADHRRAEEIERQYLQEVPAKETCRIM
nr:12609_t:CDS:2 [Entrophospora candida]